MKIYVMNCNYSFVQLLPGMWQRDCIEIQEGFERWRNCDVFKGLLYPKSAKLLQALSDKNTTTNIDLDAVLLIKSKPLEEFHSRHLFQTLLEDTQTYLSP